MLPARAAAYEQLFVPQYGARATARPVSLVTRRSCSSSWSRHASAPLGKLQPAKDICCVPGTLRTCENRYFDVARLQLQVLLPQKRLLEGKGRECWWGSYCLPLATLARLFACNSSRVFGFTTVRIWKYMFSLYETIRAYNNNNIIGRAACATVRGDFDAIPIRFDLIRAARQQQQQQ